MKTAASNYKLLESPFVLLLDKNDVRGALLLWELDHRAWENFIPFFINWHCIVSFQNEKKVWGEQ